VGLSKNRGVVLRQYRSKGQKSPMVTLLHHGGAITECPAAIVTEVFDRVLDCVEAPTYPWCTPESIETMLRELEDLPIRLPTLPILIPKEHEPIPDSIVQTLGDFSCPSCPSRSACQKDHAHASKLRQEQQRTMKAIQALRTSLWHRFQEKIDALQHFGYLSSSVHLTEAGEWARLIRIDHSLLITELIRAEAFTGASPALLAAVMSSIAHDDDRPGAFPRISTGLGSLLGQVRKLAESLSPYEDPPLLRADIAAVTEQWIGDPTLTWIGLCKKTTMAEGDIYRLLARTLEFLSQLHTLKDTHPALADSASQAMAILRRGVLEELP
jgi:ATP-dependent RNA helicase HelY